ncbi:MAG TPA: methyl-accepting chemotaxis protein [Steroidobacteraceae bacterium]|nr:methyl-accepting chemotaxis protein [Steroidobacteraceae bacterium]
MRFRNSVAARLLFAFVGVIAVFGIAVTLSIVRLGAFDAAVTEITGPMLEDIEITDAWAASVSESMRHARNMLIMDDKTLVHGERSKITALYDKAAGYARALTDRAQTADAQALLQDALDARSSLAPLEASYFQQVESGDVKGARDTLLQQSRPAQLKLMAALSKLAEYYKGEMHRQADALAVSYRSMRILLISLSLLAVSIASVLALALARTIRRPLNEALKVLGEIERGNYSARLDVRSKDEIGRMLSGLGRMQGALKERTEHEHAAAAENARIRTALDRVSVAVMVADSRGIISYANEAASAKFRELAGDIRKTVPGFDPQRLVGASLESLHRVSTLEERGSSGPARADGSDVRMGGAILRVVANPVVDDQGVRVGTVTQWTDRTQEAATEEEVQAIVARALSGDLTARIEEHGKHSFFKTLSNGVNRILDNMSGVVRSMSQAAAEVRNGAEEISRGNSDLSQRTEEQASSLQETASSMEQMTATVKNNAENATQASSLASAARERAERGGTVVGAAVAAMSEISVSSRRIADIIGVIDEIAFQTNLLALNAAVEAARAGDQGRGFAVVASEVRNLASRSAEAAKEIKILIQDSVSKVKEGTKMVDESGKVLEAIVADVKKVTDVMTAIASSSHEQAAGIEQVNKAVTMMDDVTQQNAALVEQASAAAHALTEQALNLTRLIAGYQVAGGAAPQSSAAAPGASPAAPGASPAAPSVSPAAPAPAAPIVKPGFSPRPRAASVKPGATPARAVRSASGAALASKPPAEAAEEWQHF